MLYTLCLPHPTWESLWDRKHTMDGKFACIAVFKHIAKSWDDISKTYLYIEDATELNFTLASFNIVTGCQPGPRDTTTCIVGQVVWATLLNKNHNLLVRQTGPRNTNRSK